jgi:hypothetical protein
LLARHLLQHMSYLALDNGGHPFRTVIKDGNKVAVWPYNHKVAPNRPYISCTASQILIGKSPKNAMTDYSLGYGDEYDGNSLLIQKASEQSSNLYYFVGSEIWKFQAAAPIIYYQSPVGNSSVPYPWAQDMLGNIYLMIEMVQFQAADRLAVDAPLTTKDQFDAYHVYYDKEPPFKFEAPHPLSKKVYKFKWCPEADLERIYQWHVDKYQDHLERVAKDPADKRAAKFLQYDEAPLELGKEIWMAVIRYHGQLYNLKGITVVEEICSRVY